MSVPRRAEQEMRRMETRAKFPYLVRIHNDDYGDLFYANCDRAVSYGGDEYEPAWFEFSPPERSESSIGNASITISALPDEKGDSWVSRIRGTQKRSTIEIVAVMVYEEGGRTECEAVEGMRFELTGASWNDEAITWQMVFDDNMNILVPCDICTANVTPGCA